jgi:hypothetical protein
VQPRPSRERLPRFGLGDDLRGLAQALEHVPGLDLARAGRKSLAQVRPDLSDQLVAPGAGKVPRGFLQALQVGTTKRME